MDRIYWGARIVVRFFLFAATFSLAYAEEPAGEVTESENRLGSIYAEPGHGSALGQSAHADVSVNPQSGSLSVNLPFISLPLNGGQNISLGMTYHTYDHEAPIDTNDRVNGVGWSLHFGYLDIGRRDRMCSRLWDARTVDNPVFIGADGSTTLFVLSPLVVEQSYGVRYSSAGGLALVCDDADESFYVLSPNGDRYDFDPAVFLNDQPARWHINKVTDKNGNVIQVEHVDVGPQGQYGKAISSISAQGTSVQFDYDNISGTTPSLTSIVTPIGTWDFSYQNASIPLRNELKYLVGIDGPENADWTMNYWPYNSNGSDGSASLKLLFNGFGGNHEFDYALARFNIDIPKERNAVKAHRVVNGTTTAEWTYLYYPNAEVASGAPAMNEYRVDKTTVSGPDGLDTYRFVGLSKIASGDLWLAGTKLTHKFDPNSGPNRTETFTWEPNYISTENFFRLSDVPGGMSLGARDGGFAVPRITRRNVMIGAASYTTDYLDYRNTGLPFPSVADRIIETTSSSGFSGSRTKHKYHYYDQAKWVWAVDAGTSYDGDELVSARYFDSNVNVESAFNLGVMTYYTYYDNGDLKSEKRGDDEPVLYSDYKSGVARRIDYPDGGFVIRTVNELGQITSEKNALDELTSYSYDAIGRQKTIVPPLGLPTQFSWIGNAVTATHGDMVMRTEFDRLGRATLTRHSGQAGLTVELSTALDYAGRKRSQSILHVETGKSYSSQFNYDGLGRLKSTTHPGGSKTYDYSSSAINMTDERGLVTQQDFMAFGDMGYKYPVYIKQQDTDALVIERNNIGQLVSVTQGGIERAYDYDIHHRLASRSEPETGIQRYTWDLSGNLTHVTKTDSLTNPSYSHSVTNSWDDMGRVTEKLFSVTGNQFNPQSNTLTEFEWREAFEYDLAGRVKTSLRNEAQKLYAAGQGGSNLLGVFNFPVTWTYQYNALGALIQSSLSVDQHVFTLGYEYDSSNALSSMTYPSGNKITFAPNVYGWPTRAGNYISNISHHFNGAVASMDYANGDSYSSQLDSRMLLQEFSLSGNQGMLLNKRFQYDPTGNIEVVSDLFDASRSQSFSYDGSNRLLTANGIWGNESYDYDGIGNIVSATKSGVLSTYQYDNRNRLSGISGGVQRNYNYNEWGAATKSNDINLLREFDDKVWSYQRDGSQIVTHMRFDAEGRRVRASDNDERHQYFVYDQSGKLVYQLNQDADWYKEYISAAGASVTRHVAIECSDDFDNDGIPHCKEREWYADPYQASDASADNDADGLTNLQEYQAGTNATLSDSDGDGMPDGYEVNSGLDATVNDAAGDLDGDGFSNLQEFEEGTDPLVADPPKPAASLQAIAGDGRVLLSWQGAAQSGTWRMYKSSQPITDVSVLPYVEVTGVSYLDEVAINGQETFYRVTAVNQFGESAPSPQASALPGARQWRSVSYTTDAQKNVYLPLVHVGGVAMLYYPADGSTPTYEIARTMPEGVSLTVMGRAVDAQGNTLVAWREGFFSSSLWASYYDAGSHRWSAPTRIAYASNVGGVDVAMAADGSAWVSYVTRQPVTGGDGSAQNGYVPYVSVFSSGGLWTHRRVDGAQTRTWSSSGAHTSIALAENGHAIVTWQAYEWPSGEPSSAIQDAVWANRFSQGAWQSVPDVIMRESDDCCSATFFGKAKPFARIANNGQAVIQTTSSTVASAFFDGNQWLPAQAEKYDGGFNHDSTFMSLVTARSSVQAVRQAITANGLEVLQQDELSGRKTSAIRIVPESEYGEARAFWQEDSGVRHQSVLRNGTWQEEIDTALVPFVSASSTVSADALGNLELRNGTSVSVFSPVAAPHLYGVYLDASSNVASQDEGLAIQLIASVGSLNGAMSYQWSQVSGSSATLREWSGRTFADLPFVSADETLVFSVIATDSAGVSATAEVSVLVRDIGSAPEVDAGANQTVDEGASVQLSGSASDVDDNVDTLQWQQLSGPAVALSDSTIFAPTFSAPQLASGDDILVFRLTATDTTGLSSSADVTINVTDLDPPAPDTVPPVVTYAYTGADPNNRKIETARLNSDEPSTLYYRLSGPATVVYNYTPSTDYPGWIECPWNACYFKMELGKGKDTAMIEYFARDSAGNISATQSSVVKP